MKKTIAAIILAVLLLAVPAVSALAATVSFTGNCHVRSSPSINATSLGVVGMDTCLEYMYENSVDSRGVMWFRVRYYGRSGWVSSMYSYVDDDEGIDEYMWVQVYNDANVRVAPNLNAAKLGVVYRGTSLDYVGSTFTDDRGVDWYRVLFNGMEGWISSANTVLFP